MYSFQSNMSSYAHSETSSTMPAVTPLSTANMAANMQGQGSISAFGIHANEPRLIPRRGKEQDHMKTVLVYWDSENQIQELDIDFQELKFNTTVCDNECKQTLWDIF